MEIEVVEVIGATPKDLLIRSVADNEVRKNLTRVERIRVTKKLYDNKVPVDRATKAMGVSEKTYNRDLMIAQNPWMFQHVIDNSIQPSAASSLLDEATKVKRVNELKEDIDAWIADKKRLIREKERLKKAQSNKELRPAEKEVKKYMPNYLVAHWITLLRKKRRFDEDAHWNFDASIEKDKGQLKISSVTLDLAKAPLDKLAKVAGKLSQISKQLAPYVQKRHKMEQQADNVKLEEAPYDFQYLRDLGLDDEADKLEAQYKMSVVDEPDGVDDMIHGGVEEREEEDLASDIQLPGEDDDASGQNDQEARGEEDQDGPTEATQNVPHPPPPPPPAPPEVAPVVRQEAGTPGKTSGKTKERK
jgi:hypothetical protein